MDTNLPTELYWMILSVAMTAIFFVPYVVHKIFETGLWNTLKTPDPEYRAKAEWPPVPSRLITTQSKIW